VFRGLQDVRTPTACSLASNFLNILLAPVLIFWAGWGVKGAAAAIVIAQVSGSFEGRCNPGISICVQKRVKGVGAQTIVGLRDQKQQRAKNKGKPAWKRKMPATAQGCHTTRFCGQDFTKKPSQLKRMRVHCF